MIFVLFLQFFAINKVQNACFAMPKSDGVDAEAMVTIEAVSGRVLYEKNKDKKLPMASTTKILTAIVALENCKDLNEKHLITKDMTGVEGSSIYLKTGEHVSVMELLYGLMLRSGNDSAVAIAIIVGGTLENFVKMMNDFCSKLGLVDTHIVTVNGLHVDNHFSSYYNRDTGRNL